MKEANMAPENHRAPLSTLDIERIADAITPRLIIQVKAMQHVFWIDPKMHYDEHHGLREMLAEYHQAKGIFWKVFIWAVAAGVTVLAGLGFFKGWFKAN
jgi:hypothetical protein